MNKPVKLSFPAARISKHGNCILPQCRMIYPDILTPGLPKGEKDPNKAKYGAVFLIPKAADIEALKKMLKDAALAKFGRTNALKWPLKKTIDSKSLSKHASEYPWYLRAQSNYQPVCVGPDGSTSINDKALIYSGRWATGSVSTFAWSHPTGGDGVSLSLNSVQLLDHADRIGGTSAPVEDEFIPANIEGGDAPDTDDGFGEDEDEEDDFLS